MSQGAHPSDPSWGLAHDQTVGAPAPTRHDTETRQVPPARTLGTGDRIGRYEIERPVGVGGMGVVYAAHDPQLDRRVAIKVLHAHGAEAPDLVARLEREAVALAKLSHPNVVAVHDAGVFDGRVFVAMQFVEGRTLGAELQKRPRDWRGIVALFVAAGRGLHAAHEAGLIHRDVKPGNLLVDEHGQVQVTDFGLARAADSAEPDPEVTRPGPDDPELVEHRTTTRNVLTEPVTQHGFVLGTPAYMAPEQMLGRKVTARSDQFSFCVTLWEALYGQHPFATPKDGELPAAARARLTDAVLTGALVPPPPGAKVPRWLRRAVERGLARDPEARWPSMAALVAAIAPAPHRNPWLVAGAVIAAGAAGAAIAVGLAREASPPSCPALAEEKLAPIWSNARQDAIRTRFAASGRSYAGAMADHAIGGLDAYAAAWTALRAETCAAARDRAEESQLLAERRTRCLAERLTALGALVGLLEREADPRFVDEATRLVDGLPPVADCADRDELLAVAPPPPAQAAAVDALQARLAEARSRNDAGQLREARAALDALAVEADALAYPPLTVGILRTRAAVALSELDQQALDQLTVALDLATRHRLDRDVARILPALIQAAGLAGKPDQLALLVTLGTAAAARIGDEALAIDVAVDHGRALVRLRRFREAAPVCRDALARAEAMHGATSLRTVTAIDCLTEALTPLDQAAEGLPLLERALAIYETQLGAEHPAVADYLAAIAHMQSILGAPGDQRAALERVLAIRTKAFGPRSARVAEALSDLAELDLSENALASARARTLEALAITEEVVGAESRQAGFYHHQLGMIAAYEDDPAAAERSLERALQILEQVGGPRAQEVAMVLIFLGQVVAKLDDGARRSAALLERAVSILEEWKDPRVAIAIASLAGAYKAARDWDRAAATYERALARLDPVNTAPHNRAVLRANAADAYVQAGRPASAVTPLIEAARADIAAAGDSADDLLELLDELDADLKRRR